MYSGRDRNGVLVNLKAASQRLGVHYQTAYKWVRSGSLTAIRVGGRYEVSEAAIAQLLANRESVATQALVHTSDVRLKCLTATDFLEELEAMASDPVLSVSSVVTYAAEQGAQVLGDVCFVGIMNRDRLHVDRYAVGHPEPDRAAFMSAVIGLTGDPITLSRSAVSMAFFRGQTVRIPHVAQDELRSALLPELRQYLPQYPLHSFLSAPIMSADGPVGFVAFSRDTPNHPYTAIDEQYAADVGERVGRLVDTAREIALAWKIRRELADDLRTRAGLASGDGQPTTDDINHLFERHLSSATLPIAVFDPEGRLISANQPSLELTGFSLPNVVGMDIEAIMQLDDRPDDPENFERLVSGELDYHDIHGVAVFANGIKFHYAAHRAAVRRPDASLYCILTVNRVLHVPAKPEEFIQPAQAVSAVAHAS